MSPLYESPLLLTKEKMEKTAKTHKCQCGGNLLVAWSADHNCYMLRCGNNLEHSDFIKPATINNYDLPGYNMPGVMRKKEKELVTKYGEEKTKALARIAGGNVMAVLTENQASRMFTILYPDAAKNPSGQAAIIKGSLICRDYGLNPAMDHLFLVCYQKWNKGHTQVVGETWSVVTGIKAKRLICGRDRSYGYFDNTPRIMTPDEQMKIYGEVDEESVVTICLLKDKDGNIFPGYGKWPKYKTYADGTKYPNEPLGKEKGNSMFNQSCIRGEGQSLSKLNPGAMPAIDVVDENYIPTNKVVITEDNLKVDAATGETIDEPPTEPLEGEFTEKAAAKIPEPETKAMVVGSDTWLVDMIKKLKIPEATVIAEVLVKRYGFEIQKIDTVVLGNNFKNLSDENRADFAKLLNAKEKLLNNPL